MNLVNLKENKRGSKKLKKNMRKFIQSKRYWSSKKEVKKIPCSFKETFIPYKPCGEEYVPDDMKDFTGVYFRNSIIPDIAINTLTRTTVIETLVDYGCVDNASQAIRCFKEHLKAREEFEMPSNGNFVILMTPHHRDKVYDYEEAFGTFRWHKNGYYSGEAKVCSEYFLSEPDEKLKMFYLYEVYKVV